MVKSKDTMKEHQIAIVGSTGIGKTTSIVSMAKFFESRQKSQHLKHYSFLVKQVDAGGNDLPPEKSLVQQWANILEANDELRATIDRKHYSFRLEIHGRYSVESIIRIRINLMDHAGEIFKSLDKEPIPDETTDNLKPCLNTSKWLFVVHDWESETADIDAKNRINKLIGMVPDSAKSSLRIAVVMSKCERGELWPGRKEAEEDLFEVYLPKTHKALKETVFVNHPKNLGFFASSAFGILSNETPLPNRSYIDKSDRDQRAVLIDTRENSWKPYGLLSPMIWLCEGEKWKIPDL